jgi:hypothetical protein
MCSQNGRYGPLVPLIDHPSGTKYIAMGQLRKYTGEDYELFWRYAEQQLRKKEDDEIKEKKD